jgi:hypothetical protein
MRRRQTTLGCLENSENLIDAEHSSFLINLIDAEHSSFLINLIDAEHSSFLIQQFFQMPHPIQNL